MSPKHFARICRFLNTCRLLKAHPTATTTQIALQKGFYDQAHLYHDFVAFAGLTPTAFAKTSDISFLDLSVWT